MRFRNDNTRFNFLSQKCENNINSENHVYMLTISDWFQKFQKSIRFSVPIAITLYIYIIHSLTVHLYNIAYVLPNYSLC